MEPIIKMDQTPHLPTATAIRTRPPASIHLHGKEAMDIMERIRTALGTNY